MINNEISFRAGGTLKPASFAMPDTAGDEQVIQATAGAVCVGITGDWQKGPPGIAGSDAAIHCESGDQCTVRGMGNDAMLTLGVGGITRGSFLKADAFGTGIAASVGDYVGAYALQTGLATNKVRVIVLQPGTKI